MICYLNGQRLKNQIDVFAKLINLITIKRIILIQKLVFLPVTKNNILCVSKNAARQ